MPSSRPLPQAPQCSLCSGAHGTWYAPKWHWKIKLHRWHAAPGVGAYVTPASQRRQKASDVGVQGTTSSPASHCGSLQALQLSAADHSGADQVSPSTHGPQCVSASAAQATTPEPASQSKGPAVQAAHTAVRAGPPMDHVAPASHGSQ